MKVSNETRKPLTKNQKIIAIIFIIFGGLFLLNEFAWRVDQNAKYDKWTEDYCFKFRQINPATYPKGDSICQKYEKNR